jgi:hypothetical protein
MGLSRRQFLHLATGAAAIPVQSRRSQDENFPHYAERCDAQAPQWSESRLPRCKTKDRETFAPSQMKAGPFTTASRRLFKLVQSFKRPAEMKAHVG